MGDEEGPDKPVAAPRVFISHSHKDDEVTARLVNDLRAAGVSVWVDTADLDHGDFFDRINQALLKCDWLVLVLTPNALRSKPVQSEVHAALRRTWLGYLQDVIPFMVTACDSAEIPPLWGSLHHYDATSNYQEAFNGLLRALRRPHRTVADPGDQPEASTPALPTTMSTTERHDSQSKGRVRTSGKQAPTRVFAIANQKGRVGKTITAVNLGACLAAAGRSTLIVDLSPSNDATTHLGVDPHRTGLSIYELLVNSLVNVDDVIKRDIRPNLALIPSKVDLWAADMELPYMDQRESLLRRILENVHGEYDFVLIDCPSWLGLLTINGLTAANGVILPLPCEYFALEGMQQLLNTIRLVRDRLNPTVNLFGMVLTMYDHRMRLAAEVVDEITQYFPKEKFQTLIPNNVRLSEAPSFGLTILEHDQRSPGALAYKRLAEEVIARAASMEDTHA